MKPPAPGRVPGELPLDPAELPRDRGPCSACGALELLAPGSDLCLRCDAIARTAAEGAASRGAPASCETSGQRLSDPGLVLERGQKDRPGDRVRCLRCGRELVLVAGPWVRHVAPSHPAGGGSR